MEYSQAAELPAVIDLGDRKVTFPLLDIIDYDGWCAELHAQRKQKSKTLIPANAEPIDKFRMGRMAEFDEPSLDAISVLVFTPKGARRILDMSLTKAGMTDAGEREGVIKKIAPRYVVSIAHDVSGLFEKKIPPLPDKGQPLPNAQPEPSEDSAATGS